MTGLDRGGCVSCEQDRPVFSRHMCKPCYQRLWRRDDGSLEQFGWVRADRLAEFGQLRDRQYSVEAAGARVGVSARTAWRYEADRNRATLERAIRQEAA